MRHDNQSNRINHGILPHRALDRHRRAGLDRPRRVAGVQSQTRRQWVFTLNPDGSCSSRIVMSTPSGGDITREVKATYTRTGTKLTMKWTGAGTTTGDLSGDTFTMNNEGIVFAYRK